MVDESLEPALDGAAADAVTVRRWSWRMPRSSIVLGLAPLVGLVVFLGAWQLIVEIFSIEAYKLPAPWRILRHIASDPGFYARHSRTTIWEAFVGFVLAMLLAVPLATAMALSRFIDRAVMPIAVLIQVTPIIAYAPAVVLWVGTGFRSIIVVTTVVCFVPFLVNLVSGLRSVDPLLLELADSVDAGRGEVFWRLRVPSALPNLFAAARISVGLALIGAVLGEFFGLVKAGLGFALKTAQARGFRGIDQVWGCVFVLAFIGAVATFLLSVAERAALHWHASQRR